MGEFGRSDLTVTSRGCCCGRRPREQTCWMSHRDTVFEPPPGFTALATPRHLAGGRGRERRAGHLRDPVPPRGRAHPLRPGDPQPLPHRGVRLRAHVVGSVDRGGADRAHPRAGGGGEGDLRPLRRRGLLGGGAARAPRGGGPADVRVRGPRPDAQGRGRAGDRDFPRHLPGAARGGGRRAAVPRAAARGHRAGGQAQGDRGRVHPRLRGGGRQARRCAPTWCRARSTPT